MFRTRSSLYMPGGNRKLVQDFVKALAAMRLAILVFTSARAMRAQVSAMVMSYTSYGCGIVFLLLNVAGKGVLK